MESRKIEGRTFCDNTYVDDILKKLTQKNQKGGLRLIKSGNDAEKSVSEITVKRLSLIRYSLALLGMTMFLGCSGSSALRSADFARPSYSDYVVFGLSVLCASTDFKCLKEGFNRCLGQTRKVHIRENGRPGKLTLLTTGEAVAEWRLRASVDRVTITYDNLGVARDWIYDGAWGALHRQNSPMAPADDHS
jgi:hypothetical protein